MKRKSYIRNSALATLAIILLGSFSCKQQKKSEQASTELEAASEAAPFFTLSLAQWSMHRMINDDGVDPYSFARKAKGWGFSGLEYVSQLYTTELEASGYSQEAMDSFVQRSNEEAQKHGLTNVLIMIDGEGDLSESDAQKRQEAVENHYKWVDAAAALGCHSIRVNLSGSDEPEEWKANSIEGLRALGKYAQDKGINVLVENHGGLSSNAALLAEVMEKVNMDNCGTLPDFGNFCIRRNDPADSSKGCAEQYDFYKGVSELMPFAKAVSAKSHNFDAAGNETEIDYIKMLEIVKNAGYTGFIGVEYEGSELSEEEGIIATRDLLIESAKNL
jgi:sugar phosphate isomerase/epimerase